MTRLAAPCLLSLLAATASAASLTDAFNEGARFGQSRNTATRSGITSGAGQASVPYAQPNVPEASYFGSGGLSAPASARVTECSNGNVISDSMANEACKAITFSHTNPSVRPQFTLRPSDPLFVNARTIHNDPAAIAGNIAGTYSACSVLTVRTPDIFQNQLCNEYRTVEHYTCTKTLTVNVADNGLNCSEGTYVTPDPRIAFIRPFVFVGATCSEDIRFKWVYGFSECNGSSNALTVSTIVPSPDAQRMIVNLDCGGQYYLEGSCPNGSCAYSVGVPDGSSVCDDYCGGDICCANHNVDYPLASFAWQRPAHTFSVLDAWDNQCAALEAKLQ